MEKITEQIVFKHPEVKNRSLLYIQESMGRTKFIVFCFIRCKPENYRCDYDMSC